MATVQNFSFSNILAYRLLKQHLADNAKSLSCDDIPQLVKDIGPLRIDAVEQRLHKVPTTDINQVSWFFKLFNKKIALGRFVKGSVYIVSIEDLPLYYQMGPRRLLLKDEEIKILEIIGLRGPMSKKDIVSHTGFGKLKVKLAVERLDRSFKIVRVGYENVERFISPWRWNTFEKVFPSIGALPKTPKESIGELFLRFLRSFGPALECEFSGWTGYNHGFVRDILCQLSKEGVIRKCTVDNVQGPWYVLPDEIDNIVEAHECLNSTYILDTTDPIIRTRTLSFIQRKELRTSFSPSYFFVFSEGKLIGTVHHKITKGTQLVVEGLFLCQEYITPELISRLTKLLKRKAELHNYESVIIKRINGHSSSRSKYASLFLDCGFYCNSDSTIGRIVNAG